MHIEKYKTLLKEVTEDITKWQISYFNGLEDLAVIPRFIYRFNTISIKIPAGFFSEIDMLNLKFSRKHKRTRKATATLKKKNKTGGLNTSQFQNL